LSPREAAISAIRATFTLLEDIELPTALKEYDVPKEDIPKIVDYIIEDQQHMYDLANYNPRILTKKNLTEFFEKAWEGKDSVGKMAQ
jgi:alcohol dehydrogenase class IV